MARLRITRKQQELLRHYVDRYKELEQNGVAILSTKAVLDLEREDEEIVLVVAAVMDCSPEIAAAALLSMLNDALGVEVKEKPPA